MASTTDAVTLTNRASLLLSDASQTRWLPVELLNWINDGQLEIVALVPNANPTTSTVTLAAGAKQSAPTGAILINAFVRNMGVGGTTPGLGIRQVTRKYMESFIAGWLTETPSITVTHVAYDPEDSSTDFYVYPPQPASGMSSIEIVYSSLPTAISDLNIGTKITIKDMYANALLDYILYRAFAKDSEYGNQDGKSQSHYKMFSQSIGVKYTIDSSIGGQSQSDGNQGGNPAANLTNTR